MTSRIILGCLAAAAFGTAAVAQDTTTYTYDALGRLTKVSHAGGPNANLTAQYTLDKAGNRTNVTVTGAQAQPKVIVLPLNGYTVIPLPS